MRSRLRNYPGFSNLQPYRPLLAIISAFSCLVILYGWLNPPFEGPDEPQHFAYITWLAEGNGLPPQGEAAWETPIQQEAGQPPLYYLIASVIARQIDLASPPALFRSNPHFVGPFPRTFPDNDNRAIHLPGDVKPFSGGWLALYSARGLSALMGVILLVCVYGLGRQAAPDTPQIAITATLLVALTPQIVFISSVVSNDMAVTAFSAMTIWFLAILIRSGLSFGRSLAVGIALGLAVLSKASAIALALPIAAAWLWLYFTRRSQLWDALRYGLSLVGGFGLVSGWWLIRNWTRYDSPFGLSAHFQTTWAITDPEAVAALPLRWMEVFRSYWLAFGWGTIRPDGFVYTTFLILSLLALVGLGATFYRRWRDRDWLRSEGFILIVLMLTVLGVAFGLEIWMRRVLAPYGRLMFPAAPAVSLLLAIGWRSVHPKAHYLMIGGLVLLTIAGPFLLMVPAYAEPDLLTADAVAELPPSMGWRFGLTLDEPIAELISAKLQVRSLNSGGNLPVEICWRPLAQSKRPYSILLHVIGPENRLIDWRRTYPGLGRYPTTVWQPDKEFCDLVRVLIREELSETLVYQLEIALIDHEDSKRLLAFDAQGNILPATFFDRVLLISQQPTEPFIEQANDGSGSLQLVSYKFADSWSRDVEQPLELKWGVASSVETDYQVFVHLRDQVTGQNVAQADGPPLDGWYPTSWWPAGEIITDRRHFYVPGDLPPNPYDLYVGLYDLATGARIGSENYLGEVEVR